MFRYPTYVIANLRTLTNVEQVVTPSRLLIVMVLTSFQNRLTLRVFRLRRLRLGYFLQYIRKFKLLHFGYVAQWETFRRAVTTNRLLCHDNTSLPRQFLFYYRFSTNGFGHVWMFIR
jgi:hypothetical protein